MTESFTEKFLTHWRKFRNIYIIIAAVIGFVIFFSLLYNGCSDWRFWRQVEKEKTNFNQAMNDANAIEKDIDNLNRQAIEGQAEVNQKKEELNRAQEEADNLQEIINAQREYINAIENANYSQKTLNDAYNGRCRAFPERCQ